MLHTKYESSRPCGSGEEIFFYVFPIVSLWELITPGAWSFLTPGPWLAGFIKRTTIHYYTQNMKALDLVVSERKIFVCFSHDTPGAGPVWTTGARLAGFMKRTIRHYYTQNMKALVLVVSEKIFYVFPIVSLWELITPGVIFDPRVMVGRIDKEDHYTLLHTKYEGSGPCGFREEDFLIFSP